ncbi:hypothetical protein FACS18949_11970 [Clostridia bacterium]|nr:hypothetical protein FACS18949_11970 [Clostridia bacterium]
MTEKQESVIERLNTEIQAISSSEQYIHIIGEHLIDLATKSESTAAVLNEALDGGKTIKDAYEAVRRAADKQIQRRSGNRWLMNTA